MSSNEETDPEDLEVGPLITQAEVAVASTTPQPQEWMTSPPSISSLWML